MEPRSPVLQTWTGIFLCCYAFAAHGTPQQLNSGCAHHFDKARNCCNECQAGFHLSTPCTAEKPVECRPCGEGEYLDHNNSQTECLKQVECDEMKGFEVLRIGDAVTATQCTCKANYHCAQDCEYCLRDNPCFPGFEVKEKANRKADTECRPCPPMHFSNETSFTVKCVQRTNCTVLGLMEKVPGNSTADAVCFAVGASTSLSSVFSIQRAFNPRPSASMPLAFPSNSQFTNSCGEVRRDKEQAERSSGELQMYSA
ncbi:tumor necrosis factor receptor superfamily member 11A-like [Hypanus sabinus]|uniref:tumor necrosis factor receptor superfamily member 11A-like n=1 Tax=Hypanus sabinus TaxID=79690 RepID=UPI0028C4CC4B|nr:tumor necrosis factor receptor superfamily member 11A-like [Hypanus sabinus]